MSKFYWLCLVPSLLAQPPQQTYAWRNVEIAGGGFVPGILFHPAQKDLLYARTDIGGAYRWDPVTSRWIPLNDWIAKGNGNYTGIESIGLDPNDPSRLYLAGGTYIQSWASNGAIFRSTDQGATFQVTPMPFKMGGNEDGRHAGERFAVDPSDGSRLFFGSRNAGLWKSADYGATWASVPGFPASASTNNVGLVFVVFDPIGEAIYVGASNAEAGLYRSVDGGETWKPVDGQPVGMLPNHGVLASDGSMYITYGDKPGPNGMTNGAVWKYHTRRDAWTNVTPVTPSPGTQFGYGSVALDASNPGTLMVATMDRWSIGDDIFRSTDGGATWTGTRTKSVRDDSPSPWITFGSARSSFGWWIGGMAIDPFSPGHVLYTTGATIWGTDDFGSDAMHWTPRAAGLEETAVLDLVSPPAGASLISALGDIGGFRHDDLTVSPTAGMFTGPVFSTTTGLDFAEAAPALVVRVGYLSGKGTTGALSRDGGTSWQSFTNTPRGAQAGTVAISSDGSAIVWTPANNGAVFVSMDQGGTWAQGSGINAGSRVVADRVNPRKFYAQDSSSGRILMSADGGQTFAQQSFPFSKNNMMLRAVPGIESDLWLASNGGLYHSTEGGSNWVLVASGIDNFGFGKSAVDGGYPALYMIGQGGGVKGVYRSDDRGSNWVRLNDDLHRYSTSNVIIGDPRLFGRVYVGNNGRGIIYGDPAPAVSQPSVE